jgi:hypothetical protein
MRAAAGRAAGGPEAEQSPSELAGKLQSGDIFRDEFPVNRSGPGTSTSIDRLLLRSVMLVVNSRHAGALGP